MNFAYDYKTNKREEMIMDKKLFATVVAGTCLLLLSPGAYAHTVKNSSLLVTDNPGMNGGEDAKISGRNMTCGGYAEPGHAMAKYVCGSSKPNDIQDTGDDDIAELEYGFGGHINQLVPLWAMRAGADLIAGLMDGIDEQAAVFWEGAFDRPWNGAYVDNTDIYRIMRRASAVPEPGVFLLLGAGLIGLAGTGRRFKK